jgi:hypothetical protein
LSLQGYKTLQSMDLSDLVVYWGIIRYSMWVNLILSPVYTIQVLHPSLHSRKLEFKFVYTRCKKYTQVLAGDTTNKMACFGGEEGAALCIALLCTIVQRRRLSSKKRSTWARKWLRRRRWDVFLWSLLDLQSFH